MNGKPDHRPISPYMLGPYYRFQITSALSITSRLTGVFLTVVGAPLAIAWLLCLALGQGAFEAMSTFLSGWIGRLLVLASLFSISFHLCNGIRHLLWDTGRFLSMAQVRSSGLVMLAATIVLSALTWWAAT